MTPDAALAAALGLTPVMGAVVWWDVTRMRIPNALVLATAGIFVVCGAWGLAWPIYGLALLAGAVVLGLGILIHAAAGGAVGAGDLKLVAALTPFVAARDIVTVLTIWALVAVVGLVAQRVAQGVLAGRPTGLLALDQRRAFPVGVILAVTAVVYLWSRV